MSETIPLDDVAETAARAAQRLRAGQLVVIPTDTVYAVIADAFHPAATRRLLESRQAGRTPPPVIVGSPGQARGLAEPVPDEAQRLMAAYWPGPLTLVLPAVASLTWDLGDDRGTVALRMPADELALALVGEIGPLACTGANRRGEPMPTTVDEARSQLGDAVALYVDGGVREARSSTVVDCTGTPPRVLREGAVPAADVGQVAGAPVPQQRAGAEG